MGMTERHKGLGVLEGLEQCGRTEVLQRGGTADGGRWEGDGGRLQIGFAAQGEETQWREVAAWLCWMQHPTMTHPVPHAPGQSGVLLGVRGSGCWWRSLQHDPTVAVVQPEGHKGGRDGRAMVKGQRACVVSSWLIGGFTAVWESGQEGAD